MMPNRLTLLVLSLVLPVTLYAQNTATVEYPHYDECPNTIPLPDGCTISESRRLSPGGTLTVIVSRTRKTHFRMEVRGYTVAKKGEDSVKAMGDSALTDTPHDSLSLAITHNPKYGGYIVTLTPTQVLKPNARNVKMPGPAVLIISIESGDPPYAFSGGMAITTLKDQVFVARPAATAGTFTVAEDKDLEDKATVGFATFVNVRPFRKANWFWPGVGIGLESDARTRYYFALGVRLADGIFMNAGGVLGDVNRRPAGLQEGDSLDDPNKLSNPASRTSLGLFLGLSFKFLGGGKEAFGKPFAGGAGEKQ